MLFVLLYLFPTIFSQNETKVYHPVKRIDLKKRGVEGPVKPVLDSEWLLDAFGCSFEVNRLKS